MGTKLGIAIALGAAACVVGAVLYNANKDIRTITAYVQQLGETPTHSFYCHANNDSYSDIIVQTRDGDQYVFLGSGGGHFRLADVEKADDK